jgi:hypothetical protein
MKLKFGWGKTVKLDDFNVDLSQTKLKFGLGATGHLSDRDDRLYGTIDSMVVTDPPGRWLEWLLVSRGYFGGDPGFLIEYIPNAQDASALGHYEIWCDPDEWSAPWNNLAETEIYSVEEVRTAIKETLLAYGVKYPEHQKEVLEVIKRYQL